jgi:hypothetical protein
MGMGKVDGRFYVIKLPSIGASAPQQLPDSIDLTFTLKRQCFVVEIFHLPPALGDEPSRTSSDLKATRGRATCQTLANDF